MGKKQLTLLCKVCGNILTGQQRKFCSNKCASRNKVRDTRKKEKEKDTKGYKDELKAGAVRARKSYEKKIKEEHPGAIPARRPYKHKI